MGLKGRVRVRVKVRVRGTGRGRGRVRVRARVRARVRVRVRFKVRVRVRVRVRVKGRGRVRGRERGRCLCRCSCRCSSPRGMLPELCEGSYHLLGMLPPTTPPTIAGWMTRKSSLRCGSRRPLAMAIMGWALSTTWARCVLGACTHVHAPCMHYAHGGRE